MQNSGQEVVYQIDADDRLVAVNNEWNRFATRNDSPHLCREHALNQILWRYIHDAETRHLHQTLLQRVRRKGQRLTLPFRCDSPGLRRFMEMDIAPLDNGAVEYRCRTLKTEARAPQALLDPTAERSEAAGLLRMCSWCKRMDVGGNDWHELEEAVRRLRLFDAAVLPKISHGMCDKCLQQLGFDD